MYKRNFSKRLILAISLGIMLLTGFWLWNNKWSIHDHWAAKDYVSTKDSSEVARNLKLTEKGDLVYRASQTEVDNKDSFKERCPVQAYEEASVLGCYSARRIYVLKVDEPKLAGVEEVTAAHELLHAKFERMSSNEKAEVEKLISELRKSVKDEEINRLVEDYRKNLGEGEPLDNELFAIYGTQLRSVGSDLEKIYGEYFTDRQSIVGKYENYNSEFQKTQKAIEAYDTRLAELKSQKDRLETELEQMDSELTSRKSELNQLQYGDSAEEYQKAASAYNAKVVVFNAKVNKIREIISEYNALVEKRNSEALSAKSLADKLNANVEER